MSEFNLFARDDDEHRAQWYWYPDDDLVWCPAKQVRQDASFAYLETEDGTEVRMELEGMELLEPCDPSTLRTYMPNLIKLHEFGAGAVLHQLRGRYYKDEIYTNIGSLLVSINPYHSLPIYTDEHLERYNMGQGADKDDPHIFNTAAAAFHGMAETGLCQALVISGESGSGKTEAAKYVLKFLSRVAGSNDGAEQNLLSSNPILETFGNAKTKTNHNSSRFGKYMRCHFSSSNQILGADIVTYLLEKSRVVSQGEYERNYHSFYQLLKGASADLRSKLRLRDASTFAFLNASQCYDAVPIDDAADFAVTCAALRTLRFSDDEIEFIWTVVAAVLHLGDVRFVEGPHDSSKVDTSAKASTAALDAVCSLLGLGKAPLVEALTARKARAGSETQRIPLKREEAEAARNALAKATYERLFAWLVERVNESLQPAAGGAGAGASVVGRSAAGRGQEKYIGILDIFGFEIFRFNQFEQFCINYSNEKLQQFFTEYILAMEAQEYTQEGIDIDHIEFTDSTECLRLVEGRPGLLSYMNEEVRMPQGNDSQLLRKMNAQFSAHAKYAFDPLNNDEFIVHHYAGPVPYTVQGLVEKNRDTFLEALEVTMVQSKLPLLRTVYKDRAAAPAGGASYGGSSAFGAQQLQAQQLLQGSPSREGSRDSLGGSPSSNSSSMGGGGGKKGNAKSMLRVPTLASQFQDSLEGLMRSLARTEPHFIRCIKPNGHALDHDFNADIVLDQMRCSGLFEAIRIRAQGFAYRKPFAEFAQRYLICLAPEKRTPLADLEFSLGPGSASSPADVRRNVDALLTALVAELDLSRKDVQIGKSKVFIRHEQYKLLETRWAVEDAKHKRFQVQKVVQAKDVEVERLKLQLKRAREADERHQRALASAQATQEREAEEMRRQVEKLRLAREQQQKDTETSRAQSAALREELDGAQRKRGEDAAEAERTRAELAAERDAKESELERQRKAAQQLATQHERQLAAERARTEEKTRAAAAKDLELEKLRRELAREKERAARDADKAKQAQEKAEREHQSQMDESQRQLDAAEARHKRALELAKDEARAEAELAAAARDEIEALRLQHLQEQEELRAEFDEAQANNADVERLEREVQRLKDERRRQLADERALREQETSELQAQVDAQRRSHEEKLREAQHAFAKTLQETETRVRQALRQTKTLEALQSELESARALVQAKQDDADRAQRAAVHAQEASKRQLQQLCTLQQQLGEADLKHLGLVSQIDEIARERTADLKTELREVKHQNDELVEKVFFLEKKNHVLRTAFTASRAGPSSSRSSSSRPAEAKASPATEGEQQATPVPRTG